MGGSLKILSINGHFYPRATLAQEVESRIQPPRGPHPPWKYRGKPGLRSLSFPSRYLLVTFSKAGRQQQIPVRDIDFHHLRYFRTKRAVEYLELILEARAGSQEARRSLRKQLESDFADLEWLSRLKEDLRVVFTGSNPREISDGIFASLSFKDRKLQRAISYKGQVLLGLSESNYPIPDFSILTASNYGLDQAQLSSNIQRAIKVLEKLTGRKFNDPADPLVFSLRSALPKYLPGVMPTYLNLGVSRRVLPALVERYGEEAANQIYLDHLKMLLASIGTTKKTGSVLELEEEIRSRNPRLLSSPHYQVEHLVSLAYRSTERMDFLRSFMPEPVPSVIFQEMVYGLLPENSFVGVFHTRDRLRGRGFELEVARGVLGDAIMTGEARPERKTFLETEELRSSFPEIAAAMEQISSLEGRFYSPVSGEFVVADGIFYLLQVNPAEMSGPAAMVSISDMYSQRNDGNAASTFGPAVWEFIRPHHLRQLRSEGLKKESVLRLQFFSAGTPSFPFIAISARAYFSEKRAEEAKLRGEKVILIKPSFLPTDVEVMEEVDAVVSLSAFPIHMQSASLRSGTPALFSLAEAKLEKGALVNAQGMRIEEGDWITMFDRQLYVGQAEPEPSKLEQMLNGKRPKFGSPEEEAFYGVLLAAYQKYREVVLDIEGAQFISHEQLTYLASEKMKESGNEDEARKLVNAYADRNIDWLLESFLANVDIGWHENATKLFLWLSFENKVKLFKKFVAGIKEGRYSHGLGVYVMGCLLNLERRGFIEVKDKFWRQFSREERAILEKEAELGAAYLRISREADTHKWKKNVRDALHAAGLEEKRLER